MNERIEQLAKKAGINLTPAQFSGVLEDEVDEFTLEDFAELIVRECIKCCDEIDDINKTYREVRLVDPEFGPKECIATIKAHFGVEE